MPTRIKTMANITFTGVAQRVFPTSIANIQGVKFIAHSGNASSFYVGDADVAIDRGDRCGVGGSINYSGDAMNNGGQAMLDTDNMYVIGTAGEKANVLYTLRI